MGRLGLRASFCSAAWFEFYSPFNHRTMSKFNKLLPFVCLVAIVGSYAGTVTIAVWVGTACSGTANSIYNNAADDTTCTAFTNTAGSSLSFTVTYNSTASSYLTTIYSGSTFTTTVGTFDGGADACVSHTATNQAIKINPSTLPSATANYTCSGTTCSQTTSGASSNKPGAMLAAFVLLGLCGLMQ